MNIVGILLLLGSLFTNSHSIFEGIKLLQITSTDISNTKYALVASGTKRIILEKATCESLQYEIKNTLDRILNTTDDEIIRNFTDSIQSNLTENSDILIYYSFSPECYKNQWRRISVFISNNNLIKLVALNNDSLYITTSNLKKIYSDLIVLSKMNTHYRDAVYAESPLSIGIIKSIINDSVSLSVYQMDTGISEIRSMEKKSRRPLMKLEFKHRAVDNKLSNLFDKLQANK
jgi:hypothetical protein